MSKLGVPSGVLDSVFGCNEDEEDYNKIPEAKGSLKFIRTGCFVNFLRKLYFKHGPIFRLVVGPKVRVVIFILNFFFFFAFPLGIIIF